MNRGLLTGMLLWTALFMLPSPGLRAQTPLFFDDMGCGPRAIALGQAFTAVADDASAAYYNPAGLSQIPTIFQVSFGYQYVKPMIYIDVRKKDESPWVQPPYLEQREVSRSEDISTRGLWLGISTNFAHLTPPEGRKNPLRNISLGFVMFYGLPYVSTFWNPQRRQDPYHLRYNYGFSLMNIAVSMCYRITEYLSVGGGIIPRIDTFTDTRGNYLEIDKMLSSDESPIRLNLRTQAKASASWLVGVLFHPPFLGLEKKLSLGVTYRREVSGFYGTGPSTDDVVWINPATGDKIRIFPINAFVVDFVGYNPAQVTAGLSLKPFAGMTVSTDLTWKDYSEFKFFWNILPEPRFKDTWIPRVGLDYFFPPDFKVRFLKKIDRIRFMGGYYYEPSPVPDMNGRMNILDSDKNVVSFGAGLDFRPKGIGMLKIEGYFQLHLAEKKVLHNADDPIYGRITTGGEVYNVGISITVQL